MGQAQSVQASRDMQVLVTGTTGISWRKKPDMVSKTVREQEVLLQIPLTVHLLFVFISFYKKTL